MFKIIKSLKNYIIYSFNNIIFYINNMDNDGYTLINKRIQHINTIKQIKSSLKKINIESKLYKNISSFLFGDFIEVRFYNNNDVCYYFFKNDVLSSMTLYNYYNEFEKNNRFVFRMKTHYDADFFNLIVNYLIYNDNKDNIGTLVYNSKSWLYLKDSDDFNNKIIFNMNYFKLKQFQKYLSYFKIKVLDYKVKAILDIINLNFRLSNDIKNQPLSKFI